MSAALEALKLRLAEINALRSAVAIMEWDHQTYMPQGGGTARAEHVGHLTRLGHELFTSDETRKLLNDAKIGATGTDLDMLRVTTRDIDIATKLPTALVAEKSKLSAIAHDKWVEARANNDFRSFAPILERMFEIAGEEAQHLGYTDNIYDALLDQYEEGGTAADVKAMFEAIKGPQVELVKAIASQPTPDDSFLYGDWPVEDQRKFTEYLVQQVGFDMNRGRQDTAPHPFCTGWSRGDIRLTTRFKDYLPSAIFGSLHEAGHGMYEQGTPEEWDLTPLAGGVSLGVHESQSRLWENIVGRSEGFWHRYLPELQKHMPNLKKTDVPTFVKAINKVNPSLIRVEADELTYNLHVMVRFEIESDILEGKLKVADLPDAWNAKYEQYLGITPPSDKEGCLQDVHWSMGSIGYFPTYSMGNLLSYQIWNALKRDIKDADDLIAQGEFAQILNWLIQHVYKFGRQLPPKDLVKQATGKPLSADDYLEGLGSKYRTLYGL